VIVFPGESFHLGSNANTFVAEASNLGFPPGRVPEKFAIETGLAAESVTVKLIATHTAEGDVLYWEYEPLHSKYKILVFND
jgi:hypothetical protein